MLLWPLSWGLELSILIWRLNLSWRRPLPLTWTNKVAHSIDLVSVCTLGTSHRLPLMTQTVIHSRNTLSSSCPNIYRISPRFTQLFITFSEGMNWQAFGRSMFTAFLKICSLINEPIVLWTFQLELFSFLLSSGFFSRLETFNSIEFSRRGLCLLKPSWYRKSWIFWAEN